MIETVSQGAYDITVSICWVGVGVRVWVGVRVGDKVCVREGGMNSVSVGVGDEIGGGAVVWTGGGGRRVDVTSTAGVGRISTVGVEWTAIKTTAVQ